MTTAKQQIKLFAGLKALYRKTKGNIMFDTLKPIQRHGQYFGADPEFFLKSNRHVVGSEIVIPNDGLVFRAASWSVNKGMFVQDGVQVEINPQPDSCRAAFSNGIRDGFILLRKELAALETKQKRVVKADFSRTVKISRTELAKLRPENQQFGCTPSLNAYGEATNLTSVDPHQYLYRSGGGHIHLSIKKDDEYDRASKVLKASPDKIVHVLDYLVGNMCVLMDREKGNKIRRRMYGRAGEYRLPEHGLEYRVPSNFWLQDYHLLSITFGQVRFAMSLVRSEQFEAYYEAMLAAVSMDDIRNAINNNDYNLAMKNFMALLPIMEKAWGDSDWAESCGLSKFNVQDFLFFVDKIHTQGLKYWFDHDIVEHWCNLGDAHNTGANTFFRNVVRNRRLAAEAETAKGGGI